MIESIYKLFHESNESFTIPNIDKIPKPFIDNQFMKKYNVDPKELHSTIANFELPAIEINKVQRALRKKYLNVLLKVIDQELTTLININPMIPINIKKDKGNYNALILLIKRIVKLLINEIEIIDKKKSKLKKKNNNFILLILFIVVIFYFAVTK